MAAKPARNRRRARRRYAWALRFPADHPQAERLSAEARSGLAFAERLARNSRERRESALHGYVPASLTVDELAEQEALSPVTIHGRIKQARIELFGGDVSESTIYYRFARGTKLPWLSPGCCREPGCRGLLPAGASRRRRYCDLHAGGAARVRRHRRAPEVTQLLQELGQQQAIEELAPVVERVQQQAAAEEQHPPPALALELERSLARRFSETVMREAALPRGRSLAVEQAPRFSIVEGEIRCGCGLTGSSYSARWDGSAEAAEAFAVRAGSDSARLVRETPRHAWLGAAP